ncbi:MAG: hypothetical protein AMS23_01035 [Bacteroides sp. SM1_62]|nr:MAG: hypothetical protein AMS26_04755 [Bacteroides sp. SM23_62]KPL26633.1 MAG: hypothetical protein AMS23_01035 [Bacteroides sp. SM1_62]
MNNFFHKLVKGNSITPPVKVQDALRENFMPLNIEWFIRDHFYEAVFYVEQREYLARFEPDGNMVDFRINLPLDALPERIKKSALSKGEIMNTVEIHAGEAVSYEIIYRNKKFQRFITIFNQDGSEALGKPL